jgi:hypothetical protein
MVEFWWLLTRSERLQLGRRSLVSSTADNGGGEAGGLVCAETRRDETLSLINERQAKNGASSPLWKRHLREAERLASRSEMKHNASKGERCQREGVATCTKRMEVSKKVKRQETARCILSDGVTGTAFKRNIKAAKQQEHRGFGFPVSDEGVIVVKSSGSVPDPGVG